MATGIQHFEELPEGDGVLILSPRCQILSASLQAERLLHRELSPGQILSLERLFSEASLPQVRLAVSEALQEGISRANIVAEVRSDSGPAFFLNYSASPLYNQKGKITGAILLFRDSTLTRSWSDWSRLGQEVEFDALFANLAEGVFIINTRWRIISINHRAEEITGFTRDEVLGRYCWDVFRSNLCPTGCPLKATLEDGQTRTEQEVHVLDQRNNPQVLLVNTAVIRDKQGEIVGGVESFRPLTPAQGTAAGPEAAPEQVQIIGQSKVLRDLLAMLPDVAASDASVVLEGESGTGKELFAKAIHYQSPRARGPFVAVNCSALAESLLESELFGHVKAAFTGAITSKVGRFELARGGTLFLDEIGEFKPELQVKLLRVLEERVFERVGGTRPIPLEARIIAATSRNLAAEVRAGRFREDLFYRLRTVPLRLPPLRERPEDIPPLVNHFIARFNRQYKKKVRGVDPRVISLLQHYVWPGNVRELEHVLEYAFVFLKGPIITRSYLPEWEMLAGRREAAVKTIAPEAAEDERLAIQQALEKARGKRQVAAQILGISRSSLWRKMKDYRLKK
jgi:PAS domain S-box-containing protein